MRRVPYLLWLALATLLMLSFQFLHEELSFPYRYHWPIRWYAVDGGGGAQRSGPSGLPGEPASAWVQGAILQRVDLLHGAKRPVHLTLQYRAKQAGAWIGFMGDATKKPVRELTLEGSIPCPRLPDSTGFYQVPLPSTTAWQPVTLLLKERTDLPALTLYLGGPRKGEAAEFANVQLVYADTPGSSLPDAGENLVENGDFREAWPGWAVHPAWLCPVYVPWPPTWTLVLLLVPTLLLLAAQLKWREGHASRFLLGFAWGGFSALLILGSQVFPDIARVYIPGESLGWLRSLSSILAWLVQIALFSGIGWIGGKLLGAAARFWIPLILIMAASMMTASVNVQSQVGLPQPYINAEQFTNNLGGWVWLTAAFVSAWYGVIRSVTNAATPDQ